MLVAFLVNFPLSIQSMLFLLVACFTSEKKILILDIVFCLWLYLSST